MFKGARRVEAGLAATKPPLTERTPTMSRYIKSRSRSVARRREAAVRRRFISYANVTATMAIVLSMSGGALAANHYLISSTKQISPKVLDKLKGRTGPMGPQGPAGSPGAAGKEGPAGRNLTAETPLPSGRSESGFYGGAAGSSTSGYIGTAITYVQPLATAVPNEHVVWNKAGATSTHCSGYGHADPGYLCLYDNEENGLSGSTFFYSSGFSSPSAGVILYWSVSAAGSYVSGEYTVTAA
jgi:hypothetical protein